MSHALTVAHARWVCHVIRPNPKTSATMCAHALLAGYAWDYPDPKWPNGAKLAINLVVNFEEGSEASFHHVSDSTQSRFILVDLTSLVSEPLPWVACPLTAAMT